MIHLVSGPAASGKSQFAVNLLKDVHEVSVFGTNQINQGIMQQSVMKLQDLRPTSWNHIEVQCELVEALRRDPCQSLLIDSVNQWLASLIVSKINKASDVELLRLVDHEIWQLIDTMAKKEGPIVIVTAETGAGPAQPQQSAQLLRIALGRSNQALAGFADSVISICMGIPQILKP